MSRAYTHLTAEQAADVLMHVERPLIVTHKNPDGDTVGTAAALLFLYRALGKEAKIAVEAELPERLSFILPSDALVQPPFHGRTAITVDVASRAQLGALADLFGEQDIALSIDHHAVAELFAPTFCLPDASSASEVLYHVWNTPALRAAAPMNADVARALYTAISSDTGGFRYANTSADTHRTVAALLAFPFDAADVNHRLFSSKSAEQIRAEGITAAHVKSEGSIAYAVIDTATRESAGLSLSDFDCAIDVVRSLRGCEIAFAVKETAPCVCRVSLRSTGADVARVAAVLGGGGHVRAAGCTVNAAPEEAVARVLSLLREAKP